MAGRLKELLKKYGKVAFGVHMSVSAASITGLYVAIKSNVDVESIFQRLHLPGLTNPNPNPEDHQQAQGVLVVLGTEDEDRDRRSGEEEEGRRKKKNRTGELAASTGGALALAVLCNKALFPVRVPITIALTPPVARFLARRNIIKNAL